MTWNHCGDTKPHEQHDWFDKDSLPEVKWDQATEPATQEMPPKFICPGTKRPARRWS